MNANTAATDCSSLSEYTQTPATLTADAVCGVYTTVTNCTAYSLGADTCTACETGYTLSGNTCVASTPVARIRSDFDADRKSDVLFLNTTTGGTQYWKSAIKAQAVYPGAYDTSYTYAGSGDFNGDGKADLLWSNDTTGGTQIWSGVVKSAVTYPGTYTSGFTIQK